MSLRNELSGSSPAYISKHRYLELKHKCLQYPEWKKELAEVDLKLQGGLISVSGDQIEWKDPVFEVVRRREELHQKCLFVERAIYETCGAYIWEFMLQTICFDKSYDVLSASKHIPCGRRQYYQLYRACFMKLDKFIS